MIDEGVVPDVGDKLNQLALSDKKKSVGLELVVFSVTDFESELVLPSCSVKEVSV
ncbi:hypothetical protein AU14_01105 [Marinobacter similis]|uniref:Uncharacterized protein n=1 Tax=Marinobacter similis TaxID=1420916 RepID=W5YTZ9_9GAMM|nr:hypothetical protein AU14_01105 [Marinobacter similis]